MNTRRGGGYERNATGRITHPPSPPQPLVTSCSRVYLHTKGLPLRFVALLLLSISRSSEDASFTRYGRARKYRSSPCQDELEMLLKDLLILAHKDTTLY